MNAEEMGIALAGWLTPVLGKGLLLLILGFGIAAVIGRCQSAAGGRTLWLSIMAALVLLTGLEWIAPKWTAPFNFPSMATAVSKIPELPPAKPYLVPLKKIAEPAPIAPAESSFGPTLLDRRPNPVESKSPIALKPFISSISPWFAIGAIWLAGSLFLAARFTISRVALRRLERSAGKPGASWSFLADHLAGRIGLNKSPELLISGKATVPMAWGLFRPRILLPENANDLDANSRRYLLQHELSHIVHRDSLGLLISQIAVVLHWPNPLVWLAHRRLRLAQERACDDVAMSCGGTPADYAELLVEIAKRCRDTPWSPASVALTMANGSSLKNRINSILNPQMKRNPPRKIVTLLTVAVLSGLTLGLAGLAVSQEKSKKPVVQEKEILIDAPVSNFEPVPLRIKTVNGEDGEIEMTSDRIRLLKAPQQLAQRDAVLLKLVEFLPGTVGIESARSIANTLVVDHPEIAAKLVAGSASIAANLKGDGTLIVLFADQNRRHLLTETFSLKEAATSPTDANTILRGYLYKPTQPAARQPEVRWVKPVGESLLIAGDTAPVNSRETLAKKLDGIVLETVEFPEIPISDVLDFLEEQSAVRGEGSTEPLESGGVDFIMLREARGMMAGAQRDVEISRYQLALQMERVEEARKTLEQTEERVNVEVENGIDGVEAEHAKRLATARAAYDELNKKWKALKQEDAVSLGARAFQEDKDSSLARACEVYHETVLTMEALQKNSGEISRAETLKAIAEARERLETAADRYLDRIREDLLEAERQFERTDDIIRQLKAKEAAKAGSTVAGLELEQAKENYQSELRALQELKREAGSLETAQAASGEPTITLRLRNVPLSEVLKYVAQLAGLAYEVQAHAVVFGTPEEIAAMKAGQTGIEGGAGSASDSGDNFGFDVR